MGMCEDVACFNFSFTSILNTLNRCTYRLHDSEGMVEDGSKTKKNFHNVRLVGLPSKSSLHAAIKVHRNIINLNNLYKICALFMILDYKFIYLQGDLQNRQKLNKYRLQNQQIMNLKELEI